jgi:hypothetical protein
MYMKSIILNFVRKWGVGVCLLLWCAVAYAAMATPGLLIFWGLIAIGVPIPVVKWLLVAYCLIWVPLLAYYFGRAFGLRYDKIPVAE